MYILYGQADGEKKTPAPKKPTPPAEDTPGGKVERRGRPKGSTKAAIQARVSNVGIYPISLNSEITVLPIALVAGIHSKSLYCQCT